MVTSAVRFDRGSPSLLITNQSDVSDREVRKVVAAIQKQVDRDFFPLWGWRAELAFRPRRSPKNPMHILLRNSNRKSDPGYHFVDGIPEAEVFTRDAHGRVLSDWQATLSHEVLEMIADPGVNLYARGHVSRSGRRRKAFVAYEVCDPVQDRLYVIDSVQVSDFVTPEWFEPERQRDSTPFSFLRAVSQPFELTEGGYIDAYLDGRFITVWGHPSKKKEKRYRRAVRASGGLQRDRGGPGSLALG